MLKLVLREWSLGLYTCMPGVVTKFNSSLRTASVRGVIDILMDSGKRQKRVDVVNVPVVLQGGGGHSIRFPIKAGDFVLVVYSMRGLDEWKRTHKDRVAPTPEVRFRERDAIAIPILPGADVSPPAVAGDAVVIQKDDASRYIALTDKGIELKGGVAT